MASKKHHKGRGRIKQHSINRSLAAITIGAQRQQQQFQAQQQPIQFQESEQQFQVDVSGAAGPQIEWHTTALKFTSNFFTGVGSRDNLNTEPQVWSCVKLDTAIPIIFSVCIMAWDVDDGGAFQGATVAIGVYAPDADSDVQFRGRVHLTFQGYGSPIEDESSGNL